MRRGFYDQTRVSAKFAIAMTALILSASADAATFKVLYNFCSRYQCSDGASPYAGLTVDKAGNLFGTTAGGGLVADGMRNWSYGTVYELTPDGTETVLHSFSGGSDGASPMSRVIEDPYGNLYGTAANGGSSACHLGCGTVYRISPDGVETTLHGFTGGADGYFSEASLVMDASGNLFGTTKYGGGTKVCFSNSCGTVFRIAPDGTETILHTFCLKAHCGDGFGPDAPLVLDLTGSLYGTTYNGGAHKDGEWHSCGGLGCGVIFRLNADGTETELYAFRGPRRDGAEPRSGITMDKSGNVYGTTLDGGGTCYRDHCGKGTVYKITPDGTETQLHVFRGGSDGAYPYGGVVLDRAGNLYGTTSGDNISCDVASPHCGTVFEITADGAYRVLHWFKGGRSGATPFAGLLLYRGKLYGTSTWGGANDGGTIFEITP